MGNTCKLYPEDYGLIEDDVLVFPDGSVYKGQIKEKKPHGRGIMTKKNGSSHEGEWVEGFASGYGVARYPNGDVYTGNFV